MTRQRISSGSSYEEAVGYTRAVRVGTHVAVSGTAPIWPDGSCDPDPEAQARRCLEIIGDALAEAGAGPQDVVRTVVYLVDVADQPAVARAHADVFAVHRPTNTTVVVAGLIDPRWKVEIAVDAIIDVAAADSGA